jgi:hypothetical protein
MRHSACTTRFFEVRRTLFLVEWTADPQSQAEPVFLMHSGEYITRSHKSYAFAYIHPPSPLHVCDTSHALSHQAQEQVYIGFVGREGSCSLATVVALIKVGPVRH